MYEKIEVKVTLKRRVPQKVFYKVKDTWKLTWNKYGQCLMGSVLETQLKSLKRFCWFHGMKFEINNEFGKRSNNYRDNFFSHYNGRAYSFLEILVKDLMGNKKDTYYYYCAYCGRKTDTKKITVDHIYPVAKVNASTRLQRKLKQLGYEDVNDYRNLTPACGKCNRKKGAKLNSWYIYRGRLGQHQNLMRFTKVIKNFTFMLLFNAVIIAVCIARGGMPKSVVATIPNWMITMGIYVNNACNWFFINAPRYINNGIRFVAEKLNYILSALITKFTETGI